MAAEGGRARRLTDDTAGSVVPNWSADIKWIYFSHGKEQQGWKVPLNGGPPVVVATSSPVPAIVHVHVVYVLAQRPAMQDQ